MTNLGDDSKLPYNQSCDPKFHIPPSPLAFLHWHPPFSDALGCLTGTVDLLPIVTPCLVLPLSSFNNLNPAPDVNSMAWPVVGLPGDKHLEEILTG